MRTQEIGMEKFVVLVAGGSGSRMQSALPKQFMLLANKPVLMHSIQAFYEYDKNIQIVVVLPQAQLEQWETICKQHSFHIPHQTIQGGATRFHSVQQGLSLVSAGSLVAVHDGVRPLVSRETISAVFSEAEKNGNAVPCIPLNDSIRELNKDSNRALFRENYRLVQTPQCFQSNILKKAFLQAYQESFTDCASVAEADGNKINLVAGNIENIKLTTPEDFIIASAYLH